MTHYQNYNQLSRCEKEGADYRIRFQERSSGILIMAPHGGCIEPGTTEIAHAAAGKEHSIYCFEGMRDRDNQQASYHKHTFRRTDRAETGGESPIHPRPPWVQG